MDPLFEDKIIKGLKKGETSSFEKFVEYYQKDIYNLALRYLNNEQDALDVTQEVLLKVLRKIDTFNGKSKLSTWVYRITVNYCKDYIKKHQKFKGISLDKPVEGLDGEYLSEIPSSDKGPEQAYEEKLQNQELVMAINLLDEEYKHIIILRYINELSYDEIGEILEIPDGTVKSRLNRGRKYLAKLLKERELFLE